VPPSLHVQAGLGDADDDDEAGGRKGNQFKSHLKKSEAASEFSRTKTIAQQRRSLPVYTVRDELLQVRGGGGVPSCGCEAAAVHTAAR
jgi:hypothetical protein